MITLLFEKSLSNKLHPFVVLLLMTHHTIGFKMKMGNMLGFIISGVGCLKTSV